MKKIKSLLLLLFAMLFLVSSLSHGMNSVSIVGDARNEPVKRIILHATGGPDCSASKSYKGGSLSAMVAHFQRNQDKISIHYIIGRDGQTVSMVPESQIAFHAKRNNLDSIGIELVNNGDGQDSFPNVQIQSLVDLLLEILKRNQLGLLSLRGHSEVDSEYVTCGGSRIKRKQDPGDAFPWGQVLNDLRLQLQPVRMPVLIHEKSASEPKASNTGSIFSR